MNLTEKGIEKLLQGITLTRPSQVGIIPISLSPSWVLRDVTEKA